ncbi:oxidoreductase [Limnochorda pilosa]|uniref:Oxidoreductase n=1 Tax=Limnochorda pilosa TaxID=1555112 RepID=A0A0K2SL49_LIMPI|nr:oxidoreductase [Limnochorda pilosa]
MQAEAESLAGAIQRKGGRCHLLRADLTLPEAAESLAREAVGRVGRMDVVVNDAGGMLQRVDPARVSLEFWRQVFDLNVTSRFLLTRAFLPAMRERGWGGSSTSAPLPRTRAAAPAPAPATTRRPRRRCTR